MRKVVFIALLLTGCCTCPAPPYAVQDIHPVALAADVIQWASLDSTAITANVWNTDMNVVAISDIEADIRAEVAKLPPQEPQGPWPCRWVYGNRIEPAECDEKPIPSYQVANGRLIIDNTGTVAVCAVYHTKTVKDSVWHCGPDNGVFTK